MTAATQPKASTRGRGRNLLLWVLQVATALGFLFAALAKFAGDPQVTATFDAIGLGDWFRYLIAVLEVAGAVALLVPRLAGLAGLAFVALTVGAVLTQLVAVGSGALMPVPYLVLAAVIAWGRRDRTRQLWALISRQPQQP